MVEKVRADAWVDVERLVRMEAMRAVDVDMVEDAETACVPSSTLKRKMQ